MTVAPWVLGASLLVSFTASAGHDPLAGVSAMVPNPLRLDGPALVPATRALAASAPLIDLTGLIRETDPPFAVDPGASPRDEIKTGSNVYPFAHRAAKGDPAAPLQPSLSRSGASLLDGAAPLPSRLMFGVDEGLLPPTVLMSGPVQPPDLLADPEFEIWPEDETTTRPASAAMSPAAAAAGSTGPGRGGTTPSRDGATPAVPRALALSSTTPAAADATPMVIAAAPVSLPQGGLATIRPDRSNPNAAGPGAKGPRYADLIDPDNMDREQRCLAEAVYFEARSEPEEGQAAVAQVVLNRVRSGLYPASICGVVYQNRHRFMACQFTFTCEGKSLRIRDAESWGTATRVAKAVLEGRTYLADVGAATHYHADYVRPRWAKRLKKMDVIGRHIFYKLKPGQT